MLMIIARILYVSSSIAAEFQVLKLRDGCDPRVCPVRYRVKTALAIRGI